MYECRRCMTGDCSLGQYYCSFIRHWKRPPEDGASGRRSTVFASEGKCSALVGRRDWNILISADIEKGEVDNGSRKAPGMFRLYRYSRARDILEACRHEKWSCSRLFPGVSCARAVSVNFVPFWWISYIRCSQGSEPEIGMEVRLQTVVGLGRSNIPGTLIRHYRWKPGSPTE